MPSPNLIKYSTSTQSTDLRKGNFYLGVSDKDYGPTNITNYYNGVTSSGYVTYIWDGVEIRYNSAANDDQLNSFYSGLDSVKNFALPLSANWPAKRSDIVEITDGSIPPPNAGARVWRCTVNNAVYANTLHRMWNEGTPNGIIGSLGNYYYRYYLWVRGAASNSSNCCITIDISDGGGQAGFRQLVGTSSEWRLVSTIDQPGTVYNASKFFDIFFDTPTGGTSSSNGDIFYISSIHVVSINAATASELISLQHLPFPGYIDYSATKQLTFTSSSQCLFYAIQRPKYFAVNKTYESIVTDGLRLHYDVSFASSYPRIGETLYDVGHMNNNATLLNGATFSGGDAIIFDGTNDYALMSATVSLSATSDWTIQAWVSSNATQTQTAYLRLLGNGVVSNNFFFFEWNNRILARNSNDTGFVFFTGFTPALPLNNTPFLLNIMNRGGFLEVYCNATKTTASATFSGTLLFRDIMRERGSTNPGGRLFSFSYYDRAISSDEVLKNYQSSLPQFYGSNIVTDGLVVLLDAGYSTSFTTASNTWFNVAGTGSNATLINGPTYSSANGGSILFDGVNDYASFVTSTSIGLNWSMSAWFNCATYSFAEGLVNIFSTNYGPGWYAGTLFSSGRTISWYIDGNWRTTSTNIWAINTWYNICATIDGRRHRYFLNGILILDYTSSSDPTSASLGSIGRIHDGARNFPGRISQYLAYRRALSQSEILQNFNAQKSRYGL